MEKAEKAENKIAGRLRRLERKERHENWGAEEHCDASTPVVQDLTKEFHNRWYLQNATFQEREKRKNSL